ncbi:hypothetical protein E4P39_03880 [Blastococcus sp. CT_GayMR19]|uniref:hypothetical protein n=1 Tax=Blastococcus sp. CT_GayMR19 TaxID=2559608 RepID=UPI0010743D77|nr:hypothetical protein [Blastococcus sp. CT_GayMR19]TFV78365.1 hypothetical protein E4P39_03880 [Blastococcus sp. CT_GayMR19]
MERYRRGRASAKAGLLRWVLKQARWVASGVRRRMGRHWQRLGDTLPRRLPTWQEPTVDAVGDDLTVATSAALRRRLDETTATG